MFVEITCWDPFRSLPRVHWPCKFNSYIIRLYGIEMLPSYWIGTSHSCQQYCSCRLLQELLKKCEAPGSSNHSNFWHLEAFGVNMCKYVETTIARNHKEPTTIYNNHQWIISNLNKPSRRKSEIPASLAALMGPCGQPRWYSNWSVTLLDPPWHRAHVDPCACHWSPVTNEFDC